MDNKHFTRVRPALRSRRQDQSLRRVSDDATLASVTDSSVELSRQARARASCARLDRQGVPLKRRERHPFIFRKVSLPKATTQAAVRGPRTTAVRAASACAERSSGQSPSCWLRRLASQTRIFSPLVQRRGRAPSRRCPGREKWAHTVFHLVRRLVGSTWVSASGSDASKKATSSSIARRYVARTDSRSGAWRSRRSSIVLASCSKAGSA